MIPFKPLIRVLLGLVFLSAGLAKAFSLAAFIEIFRGYELVPETLAPLLAFILTVTEILLGAFLVIGRMQRVCLAFCTALLTGFLIVLSVNLYRGRSSECGCFIGLVNRETNLGSIGLGIVLLVASIYLWHSNTFSTENTEKTI